jgi:colanic acid/amylovoran biosynthesis protein
LPDQQIRLCLVGAPLGNSNLGVSALGVSVLSGVLERMPDARIILFDNGRGRGPLEAVASEVLEGVQRQGAWFSKRLYRQESLIRGAIGASLGSKGNMNVRAMTESTAVMDISGGDSFSDIYGVKRFSAIALSKRLALHLDAPLLLLPQTYGPFAGARTRRIAQGIVQRADRAWARDPESYEILRELAGADYDPARHREGVDVAFALPPRHPTNSSLQPQLSPSDDGPLVGVNVSGLLCNDPAAAAQRFGLRADVLEATTALVRRLLDEGARVVLVPHVRGDGEESDDRACAQVLARTDPQGHRVSILASGLGASETKWCIAKLDWMMGSRMHATIAALSSRVPVAGLAYSDKFAGVFDRCGVGDQALDLRRLTTVELLDAVWASFEGRQELAGRLTRSMPSVVAMAAQEFDELVHRIRQLAERSSS